MPSPLLLLLLLATALTDAFQHETTLDESQGVRLRWTLSTPNIHMQLEASVTGYVSVGWSKEGRMANSFVAFGADQNGTRPVELILTMSSGSGIRRAPDQTLQNATVVTAHGVTTLTFARAIDHATRPIPIAQDTNMIWAVHTSAKGGAQHTAQGSFVVNLSTGSVQLGLPWLLIVHGVLMTLAFSLAFPLGVLWARFRGKGQLDRIARHKQLQMIGAIFALVAFALVVISIGDDGDHFDSLHAILGLIVVIWTTAQFLIGYQRPEFGSKWRPAWQAFHLVSGRILFVIGPVVAALGAALYLADNGRDLLWLFALIVILGLGTWIGFVALWAMEYRRERLQAATRQQTNAQ